MTRSELDDLEEEIIELQSKAELTPAEAIRLEEILDRIAEIIRG